MCTQSGTFEQAISYATALVKMARESIFVPIEDRDTHYVIIVMLGMLAIFSYPYYVKGGVAIIGAVFVILVTVGRWQDDRTTSYYRTLRRPVNSR